MLKDVVVIISSFVAVVALGISIKSYVLSKQSVEIANRPYLTIKPVKFEDTDSYLKVTADYNKLSVSFKAKFQKLIKAAFDRYNSGEEDITWQIPFYYSSLLNPSKKYLTMFSYKINKKGFLFIKSEMK